MFIGWWKIYYDESWEKKAQRDFDDHIAMMLNAPVVGNLRDKRQPSRRDGITRIRKFVDGIR